MTQLVVGISDMKVSNEKNDRIITYSLGSCIGLSLYDPTCFIGGMIHCMLPLSKMNPEKAKESPCMFIDTGVMTLLQTMFDMGAQRKNIIAKIAGASSMLDDKNLFRIGERNNTIVRKILWKNNILISAENVGGTISRTLILEMITGNTYIKTKGQTYLLTG